MKKWLQREVNYV